MPVLDGGLRSTSPPHSGHGRSGGSASAVCSEVRPLQPEVDPHGPLIGSGFVNDSATAACAKRLSALTTSGTPATSAACQRAANEDRYSFSARRRCSTGPRSPINRTHHAL